MPSLAKADKKNGQVILQESNRERLKKLMRRMASTEFSAPLKAAIERGKMPLEYRRTE